jgi:uncharacterized protein YjbI with pentapeptide repeats
MNIKYKIKSLDNMLCVNRYVNGLQNGSIPFDPANTDYANFKKEVLAGAELQDADGNVMTQADAFIATLP